MRKEFEMSQAQLEAMLKAMTSSPLIMLQCGMPPSVQDRANAAWKSLGQEMGFDGMSVQPCHKGERFFTAESTEKTP